MSCLLTRPDGRAAFLSKNTRSAEYKLRTPWRWEKLLGRLLLARTTHEARTSGVRCGSHIYFCRKISDTREVLLVWSPAVFFLTFKISLSISSVFRSRFARPITSTGNFSIFQKIISNKNHKELDSQNLGWKDIEIRC